MAAQMGFALDIHLRQDLASDPGRKDAANDLHVVPNLNHLGAEDAVRRAVNDTVACIIESELDARSAPKGDSLARLTFACCAQHGPRALVLRAMRPRLHLTPLAAYPAALSDGGDGARAVLLCLTRGFFLHFVSNFDRNPPPDPLLVDRPSSRHGPEGLGSAPGIRTAGRKSGPTHAFYNELRVARGAPRPASGSSKMMTPQPLFLTLTSEEELPGSEDFLWTT
ncbi:hypothetical protein C8R46DRAFT_1030564 [Mycena filopes]|nr:hypothetical protein C8R46DRAFT_1030564 [Mycena filopes]